MILSKPASPGKPFRLLPRLLPVLLIAALGVYFALALHSMYWSGLFTYHDVSLVTDFLANTARRGDWFRVSETGVNHLSIHFSPTLFLLAAPLFAFVDSQFVFILLGLVSVCAAWAVALLLPPEELTNDLKGWRRSLLITLWVLVLALNFYGICSIVSAHWEPLYLPLGLGVLVLLLRGTSWAAIAPLWILALGMRQDVGFFLGLQSAALLLLPRAWLGGSRRKIAIVAVGSLVYSAIVIKGIMPLLGEGDRFHITRWWGSWGSSWGEIFVNALTHPARLFSEIRNSAFIKLNANFLYLPLLSGWAFWVANAPGVLFYISSATEKKYLWYYNSALLLPGIIVCASFGLGRLTKAVEKGLARLGRMSQERARSASRVAVALLLLGWVIARIPGMGDVDGGLRLAIRQPVASARRVGFAESVKELDALLRQCPQVQAIAADERMSVFLPLRYRILLLDQYLRADLVVISHAEATMPPGMPSVDRMRERISKDPSFERVESAKASSIWIRKGLGCGPVSVASGR